MKKFGAIGTLISFIIMTICAFVLMILQIAESSYVTYVGYAISACFVTGLISSAMYVNYRRS